MMNRVIRAGIMSLVIATSLMALSEAVAAKSADPVETCRNPLLTYRQRYQCQEELDNVQTKADQKKVVRKFSDLIRAAEKANADK
ncbi:MAG: hypothetical protein EPO08_06770 [Rhodospirillaceae bacterium]|nr:MAG: hypothetical protein EPO08_06770 [Rhodospirillaceae bacterium]